jgi:chromosome partitioning protein
MIISVLNQKGGSGKTTLAVNLARSYTKTGAWKALLVDSDRQGSALHWHEKSGGELIDLTCLPVNTLDKDVLKFTKSYDRIIIDGVPRISPLTICAIKAADLILIPVQPSPYDIWATEDLVRSVKERIEMTDGKTKAAFVVSRRDGRTKLGNDIVEQLTAFELPIFLNGTYARIDYAKSVDLGLTVLDGAFEKSEAAKEIYSITAEIEEFMSNGTY